ncbi:HNH endonuclease [Planctomonas sp. JC2975]|uniref:GmrSD restriction endonuclease domain-containing protein n=1 Tax=Planctomonas sp. JC2975 TaxID=2729626 RepID=UPI001474B568|nr:HNH endonuclease [Planctomonas sp. JC2975]
MPPAPARRALRTARGTLALIVVTAAALSLAACSSVASALSEGSSDGSNPSATISTAAPAASGTALAALDTIPVKGRAPHTGYDRVGDFGEAWKDIDGNHCDTRDDVLSRDLLQVVKKGSCTVETGVLNDPYTGKTIDFQRGVQTSLLVQIDHVVPLSDAWETGAQQLTQQQRETMANDPLELLAVDGPTNSAKGDGDAATWLPPNRSYWCTYAAKQVSVKAAYHLWVTQAEHDALERILGGCPSQQAWVSALAPTVGLG